MMLSLTPEHQEQPVSGIALAAYATGTGHSIHDKCSVCVCVFVCVCWGEGCQLTSKTGIIFTIALNLY